MLCDKTTALCFFQVPIPFSLYVLQLLLDIQQFISSHKWSLLSANTCHLLFPGWHLINWQNDLLANVIYHTYWDKQDGGYWDLIVCVQFFFSSNQHPVYQLSCSSMSGWLILIMTWINLWTVEFSYAMTVANPSILLVFSSVNWFKAFSIF